MATLNILWHFFIVAVLRNGKTNKFVLPLSTLTLRSTCDILFRQAWENLTFLQGRRDHAESVTTTSDYDERKTVRALQEWIDSCLNMSLKAELLREIFYHEFDFSRNVGSNLHTQNAIDSSVDIYFRIWRVLFKILFHPAMKDFIIPDVKSILIDRMYLKMENHLIFHTGILLILFGFISFNFL